MNLFERRYKWKVLLKSGNSFIIKAANCTMKWCPKTTECEYYSFTGIARGDNNKLMYLNVMQIEAVVKI